jgi:hypothetical protein
VASYGASPDDGGLRALLDSSPAPLVHTSVAAEAAFLLGLVALCAAPFSVMHAMSLGVAVAGVFFGLVGMAAASRPNVSGGVLAPVGLLSALAALSVVGLRYLGLDTAVGDELVPTIREWLEALNGYLPKA